MLNDDDVPLAGNSKQELLDELETCVKAWENLGYCHIGGRNECFTCPVPYLLLKLITGEVLSERFSFRWKLEDWKDKLIELKEDKTLQ